MAAAQSSAAKWRRRRFNDNREPAAAARPMTLSTYDDRRCWCLKPLGHDWPGKDDGAPHPRDTQEDLR
ncbi:hypothetical protein ACIQPQ_34525 [Streptomyces sp. NPDC091281]|uniref:hypothetical protein n=1 Tax=Streptomyces sp. NPDC091281 TaxID=3365985 RepID=UPI003813799F